MAPPNTRFVAPLPEEDRVALEYLRDHGEAPRIRRRAHAVLLSAARKSVLELVSIFDTSRQTISAWLDRWEAEGIKGLGDKPRCGAPRKLTDAECAEVVKMIEKHPTDLRAVQLEVKDAFGKSVGRSVIRRIARGSRKRYKRIRRSLKAQRDEEAFRETQALIADVIADAMRGTFDLFYCDEAGFSLTPTVSYAWQAIGQTIEVPSRRSPRVNVLGFMSYDGKAFHPYTYHGTIDAEIAANLTRDFVRTLRRDTIIVIDNASVHTGAAFQALVKECEERNIIFLFLTPYSPELNRIEVLWRMVKHRWLPFEAYKDMASLLAHLDAVFAGIGKQYRIAFAESTQA